MDRNRPLGAAGAAHGPHFQAPPVLPPPPQRHRNLWLVCGTVILVVAVAMAVSLVVVQRIVAAGGGGDLIADETCERFDLGSYETLFGQAPDPDLSTINSRDEDRIGELTCIWSHFEDGLGGGVTVTFHSSEESAMDSFLDEKDYWSGSSGGVSDYAGAGEDGFKSVEGHGYDDQKPQLWFVSGRLTVTAYCWLDVTELSSDDADAFIEDIAGQAGDLIAD